MRSNGSRHSLDIVVVGCSDLLWFCLSAVFVIASAPMQMRLAQGLGSYEGRWACRTRLRKRGAELIAKRARRAAPAAQLKDASCATREPTARACTRRDDAPLSATLRRATKRRYAKLRYSSEALPR